MASIDFKKCCVSVITEKSAFECHTSLVWTPPTPSNEPCAVGGGRFCPPPLTNSRMVAVVRRAKRHSKALDGYFFKF